MVKYTYDPQGKTFGNPKYPKHVKKTTSYSSKGSNKPDQAESEIKPENKAKDQTNLAKDNQRYQTTQKVYDQKGKYTGTIKRNYVVNIRSQEAQREYGSYESGYSYGNPEKLTDREKNNLPQVATVSGTVTSSKDAVGITIPKGQEPQGFLYRAIQPKEKPRADGMQLKYLAGEQKGEVANLKDGLFIGDYAKEKVAQAQERKNYAKLQNYTLSTRRIMDSGDIIANLQLYIGTKFTSERDPAGLVTGLKGLNNMLTSDTFLEGYEKTREQYIKTTALDLYSFEDYKQRGDFGGQFLSMPITKVALTYPVSAGLGVPFGMLSKFTSTGGKVASSVLGGLGVGMIGGDLGMSALQNDWDAVAQKSIMLTATLPLGVAGFKKGYQAGYNAVNIQQTQFQFNVPKETKVTNEKWGTIKEFELTSETAKKIVIQTTEKGIKISPSKSPLNPKATAKLTSIRVNQDTFINNIAVPKGQTLNIVQGEGINRGFFGNLKINKIIDISIGKDAVGKDLTRSFSIGKGIWGKEPSTHIGINVGKNMPSGKTDLPTFDKIVNIYHSLRHKDWLGATASQKVDPYFSDTIIQPEKLKIGDININVVIPKKDYFVFSRILKHELIHSYNPQYSEEQVLSLASETKNVNIPSIDKAVSNYMDKGILPTKFSGMKEYNVFSQIGGSRSYYPNQNPTDTITFSKVLIPTPKGTGTSSGFVSSSSSPVVQSGGAGGSISLTQMAQQLATINNIVIPTPTATPPSVALPVGLFGFNINKGTTLSATKTQTLTQIQEIPSPKVKMGQLINLQITDIKGDKKIKQSYAPIGIYDQKGKYGGKYKVRVLNDVMPKYDTRQDKQPLRNGLTDIISLPKQKRDFRQSQVLVPISLTKQKVAMSTRGSGGNFNISSPPDPIPIQIPNIKFPSFADMNKDDKKGKKSKKGRQSGAYTGSLGGLFLGMSISKIPKKRAYSGTEIRPIVNIKKVNRKRNKRR